MNANSRFGKIQTIGMPSNEVEVHDEPIGTLLQESRGLSDEQLEQISRYQHEHGLRFGEAAVALQLATPDDILAVLAKQFHYPFIPHTDESRVPAELVFAVDPFSEKAEIFRNLRTQLLLSRESSEQDRPAIAVVSPASGDGKTYVAANLAAALSQLGGNTLLIDANLRRPRVARLFHIDQDAAGLSNILSGRHPKHVFHQVASLPSLFVLPSGPLPPNPQELLQRLEFRLLLEQIRTKFDHVVIDTPSSSQNADFRVITALAGRSVAVARQDHTLYASLEELIEILEEGPGELAGVVLNRH